MIASPKVTCFASLLLVLSAPFALAAPLDPVPDRIPGELLVKFRPAVTAGEKGAARAAFRTTHARRLAADGPELWRLEAAGDVEQTLHQLRASGQVEYAEPNFIREPRATIPNDPAYSQQWGFAPDKMNLPAAWDLHSDASGVVIAIIDDGMRMTHEDLAANLWVNPGETTNGQDDDGNGFIDDLHGWDFAANDNDPSHGPADSHGTMVAGAAGAVGNNGKGGSGPAWTVRLMPLRTDRTIATLVQAYDYAAANGAHIVNASLGGPQFSQAEYEAVARLRDAGVLLVVAAGNGAHDNDELPDYPAGLDLPNVLAVAASKQDDQLATFTQIGPTSVDVAAPGQSIYLPYGSRDNAYALASGTSFSAPYVAGVAALTRAYRTGLGEPVTYQALKGRTMAGVDPNYTGRLATDGRVNAYNALMVPPQPVLVVKGFAIDDSDGNNNGVLDPGETVRLRVTLENTWAAASGINATLASLDPDLTVVGGGSGYPDLAAGQSGEASIPYTLQVAAGAQSYRTLPLKLEIAAAGGYSATRHFTLHLGRLELQDNRVTHEGVIQTVYWDRIRRFHFDIPAGVRELVVSTASDSTDVDLDLLLQPGSAPRLTACYYSAESVCRDPQTTVSIGTDSSETITIESPQAGTWYATVVSLNWYDNDVVNVPYRFTVSYDPEPQAGGGGGGGSAGPLLLLALVGVVAARRRNVPRRSAVK